MLGSRERSSVVGCYAVAFAVRYRPLPPLPVPPYALDMIGSLITHALAAGAGFVAGVLVYRNNDQWIIARYNKIKGVVGAFGSKL